MPRSELVQSLVRGLELLRMAASRPGGMRLNELAQESGLKKNTTHNLVRTLCARGFLIKDTMNRFSTGPAIFELLAGQHRDALRERAGIALLQLSNEFSGDTLTVSTIDAGAVRCVLRISPDRPGELQKAPEISFAPYTSTTAVALQAGGSEAAAALEQQYPFEEYGAGMWGTRKAFAKAKTDTRKKGYFLRQKEQHFTLAFLLPDCLALGFSGDDPKSAVTSRIVAAARFRSAIQ
ncbi:MAG: helix-turn-helix domain-containing protein [Lentisphaeria bacterium]